MKHPKIKPDTFKKAIYLIITLQLMDLLTTFIFLSMKLPEGNPLFKIMAEQNFSMLAVIKIFITFIVAFFLFKVYKGEWWSLRELKKSYAWKNLDYSLNFFIILGLYVALHNAVGIVLHILGIIY